MSINAWGSDDPAEVAKGGTGNATLTDHGVLLGSGTSPVTVTSAPTDGQILIGSSGSDPALAVPTGDTNEISITAGSGSLAVGIADNPVIPGSADIQIPSGNTAAEPSATNGMLRYDTDTDNLRAVVNSAWVNVTTGPPAGLIYLTSAIVTSTVASIEFDNTYINTYDSYFITFRISPDSSSYLLFRISNDNGSTFHTSGYQTAGAAGSGNLSGNVTADFISNGFMVSNTTAIDPGGTTRGTFGSILFQNVITDLAFTSCTGTSNSLAPSTTFNITGFGGGQYLGGGFESNNAIQLIFTAGDIDAAEVHLYGIATS